jgi:hypothetical protein
VRGKLLASHISVEDWDPGRCRAVMCGDTRISPPGGCMITILSTGPKHKKLGISLDTEIRSGPEGQEDWSRCKGASRIWDTVRSRWVASDLGTSTQN